MADRTSCCDDIVETMGRVDSLEEWRDRYILDAQRARDLDHEANTKAFCDINTKLDHISERLTTYVNPVLTAVISAMATIIGLLAGALYVLAR